MMNRVAMGVLAGVAMPFAAGHFIANRAHAGRISDAGAAFPDPIRGASVD
jgi:hypothetical protein